MQVLTDCHALKKRVGENIELIRAQKKKTIKETASFLKLSKSAYRNIERGISEIGLSKIFLIAEFFGVHYSQLLDADADTQGNAPGQDNSAVTAYRQCLQQYKEENAFLKRQIALLLEPGR